MKLTRKKWKIRTEVIKTHVIEYIMGVFLNVANISVWVSAIYSGGLFIQ